MREDEDQVRHYVPLLRRIIILAAVLIAVPVVLWTITAFVRAYVGPPKIPSFRQLATVAKEDVSGKTSPEVGAITQSDAAQQTKVADVASAPATTADARPAATDARDIAAPAGALPGGDRSPDMGAGMTTGATKMTDAAASVAPPALPPPVIPAAPTTVEASATPVSQSVAADVWPPAPPQITGTIEPPAETLPAAAPLPGPIPLPRRRPSELAMLPITAANVPMPRARPDNAVSAPTTETSSAGPLDFLQNIFHQSGNSE
jgi:hypothetical protein